MNLILLLPADFVSPNQVRLRDRRLKHVVEVHRAGIGDELTVGVLEGKIGRGRITALDHDYLDMEVDLTQDPPVPLPVTLILALPRPKVLGRILFNATAHGVKRIVLFNTWRVEKSFWDTPKLDQENLRDQMLRGLEQARDTRMPEVWIKRRFRPFVEDELPSMAAGTRALVAHPPATEPCPRGLSEQVTLALGPEGGFIANEVAMFEACGFRPVHLGNRILTIEAAVPAVLGRLF